MKKNQKETIVNCHANGTISVYVFDSKAETVTAHTYSDYDLLKHIETTVTKLNILKNGVEKNIRTDKDRRNQKIVQSMLDKYNELRPRLEIKQASSTYRTDKTRKEESMSQILLLDEIVNKACPGQKPTDIRA